MSPPRPHRGSPELAAVRVHGMSREAFLARATLAAGAVYGVGAVAPFVRRALAQEAVGDVGVLSFALLLEDLEATFYEQALRQVRLDTDARRLTEELGSNEREHATALRSAIDNLRGTPAPAPVADFGDAFRSQSSYLELAQTLEDTGVSAYNGAGLELGSKEALAAVGSIAQVEGRHAGLVRMMRDEKAAPKALDDALRRAQIREKVAPFIVD